MAEFLQGEDSPEARRKTDRPLVNVLMGMLASLFSFRERPKAPKRRPGLTKKEAFFARWLGRAIKRFPKRGQQR